jgi:outer membrane protein assembly factor BamE
MKHFLLPLLSVLILTACQHDVPFAYRMDIQQGNVLPPEKIDEVKVGMNAYQVEALLGAPISRDTFKQNRWDYVYYFKKNHKPVVQRRASIYFDSNGVVTSVSRHDSAAPPSGSAPAVDKSQSDPVPPPASQESPFDQKSPPDVPVN